MKPWWRGLLGILAAVSVVLWSACEGTPGKVSSPSYPSRYLLTISSQPDTLPADGTSIASVRAYCVTEFGDPVAGVQLFFTTTGGSFKGEGVQDTSATLSTDETGYVFLGLEAGTVKGTFQVTVSVEDARATTLISFI